MRSSARRRDGEGVGVLKAGVLCEQQRRGFDMRDAVSRHPRPHGVVEIARDPGEFRRG
jgi:hypothetical protein